MIRSKQLAQALYDLSLEKEDFSDKFLSFVKENKLEAQLPSVLYHLDKIIEKEKEKSGIQIEVAHEVSKKTIEDIKIFLQAEKLPELIKNKKELIAGFRAKWNGVIYDASIATGIKKLKETIINN